MPLEPAAAGMTAGAGEQSPGPVEASARIHELDALRGLALLGILLANVRQMFLPWEVGNFAVPLGTGSRLAWLDWQAFHALVDLKFLTLFSLLFGIGFALQNSRLSAHGGFSGIYLRRLLILALFGIAHALLLYPAEVLLPYAIGGALLLGVRRLSTGSLFLGGLVLLGASTLWSYQLGSLGRAYPGLTLLTAALLAATLWALRCRAWPVILAAWLVVLLGAGWGFTVRHDAAAGTLGVAGEYQDAQRQLAAMSAPDPAAWPRELWVRRQQSFPLLVSLHAAQYADVLFYFAILLLWRTLALFMIGAALFRSGTLRQLSQTAWKRVAAVGLLVGLPLSVLATWLHGLEIRGLADLRFPEFLHQFSALPLSAGIAGSVFVLHRMGSLRWVWRTMEAAGRMALTNYIGQSLATAALAESWGLDLYARLSGPSLTLLAVGVFTVLAVLSQAWLASFRMGPLEWLWRCGTYWRWLPIRRTG